LLNAAINCQIDISNVARACIWHIIWRWEVRHSKLCSWAANEIFHNISLIFAFIDLTSSTIDNGNGVTEAHETYSNSG
jgi:hypothetical protein